MCDTTRFDPEAVMVQAIVEGYARKMARAWMDGNDQEVERIRYYIEGNYGKDAMQTVAALAVTFTCNLVSG